MKRFAIVLTALLAVCAASAALAQSSIAEQMRALRERRAGGAAAKASEAQAAELAPQRIEQAAQEPAPASRVDTGSVTATGEATMADQMQLLREQAHRERAQAGN